MLAIRLARPALPLALALVCCLTAGAQDAPTRTRLKTIGPSAEPGPLASPLPPARPGVQLPAGAALPRIMLTGYWPPTNEAVRRFSPDPGQNPLGWIGANWEGRGYDVYAYFPEFTPPTCGACGKGTGDLEVDYQDTSTDFWNLADGLAPIAVVTYSRGALDMSWEVENNLYNKSSWFPDYMAPVQPTPTPPDASVPPGTVRHSTLPKQRIVNAVAAAGLGLNPFICFSSDAGGFLSEFIGYHGVWYQDKHASPADPAWCISAGHIHVGSQVSWSTATLAAEVTLREVIVDLDFVRNRTVCQSDLGFGGPGSSLLAVCGGDLASGTTADLSLSGGLPGAPAWLVVGASSTPTPLFGGTIVPVPASLVLPFVLDGEGALLLQGIAGGGGPATLFGQAVHLDASLPGGFGISNAVALQLKP